MSSSEAAQKLWDTVSWLVVANRMAGNPGGAAGLTPEQVGVMMALRHGPLQMRRLAAMCSVTPSAATRLVDRLVAKKLVVRQSVPESHRAVLISVTPEGKRVQSEVMRNIRQRYEKSISVLAPDQVEALLPILDTLLAKLPAMLEAESKAQEAALKRRTADSVLRRD